MIKTKWLVNRDVLLPSFIGLVVILIEYTEYLILNEQQFNPHSMRTHDSLYTIIDQINELNKGLPFKSSSASSRRSSTPSIWMRGSESAQSSLPIISTSIGFRGAFRWMTSLLLWASKSSSELAEEPCLFSKSLSPPLWPERDIFKIINSLLERERHTKEL